MQFLKNLVRIIKIIYVLAKHDALSPIKNLGVMPLFINLFSIISLKKSVLRPGQRIALALEELGPIYIKIGQMLSTRADLVDIEFSNDLSRLRDKLPPFPFSVVKNIIEKEFKKKLEDLFLEFNEISTAAASIAQVHKAKTKNGVNVAVKILRPNIELAFKQDIELFFYLAKKVEKKNKRFRATEVVQNFAENIKIELDLRLEAASASELRENCIQDDNLYIPEIDWERTSSKVLTLEWVDAVSIYETQELSAKNLNLNNLAKNLALIFFNQAFRDGFFHADLHPGNVLVRDDGKIVLVDYGIMGRLSKDSRLYVAQILYGFLKRDYHYIAKVHFNAGYIKKESIEHFAQYCRAIGEPIIGMPVNKISIAHLLTSLFKITEDSGVQIQPKLLSLQKTMMLVEGIGHRLNPEINMWQLVEPWVEQWAIENLGIEVKLKKFISKLLDQIKEKVL